MPNLKIHILDLNFQGQPHAIASFLILHAHGGILIESGPGSTTENLKTALHAHGLTPANITHVLLTHIHLDHAGAAGWLAQRGAHIFVHHIGAPHMLAPERLLVSAKRIYQEKMDDLWGEFLPVPADQLTSLTDGETITIGNLQFTALDTPGHASHHMAYLLDDICFSGDVGGVRLPGADHIRLPAPPPELNLAQWRTSLNLLQKLPLRYLAPTHFGIFDDPQNHLTRLKLAIDALESWIDTAMPANPEIPDIEQQLTQWTYQMARQQGLSEELWQAYELINPIDMSASGIHRYWHKILHPAS